MFPELICIISSMFLYLDLYVYLLYFSLLTFFSTVMLFISVGVILNGISPLSTGTGGDGGLACSSSFAYADDAIKEKRESSVTFASEV